jgi:hypothetical protein
MVPPNVAIRLLAAACVLTGVAFAGGAMAASNGPDLTAPTVSVSVQTDAADKPNPACARKVKVVYAGYGEADRIGCATTAKAGE